jgi:NAD(P)-dependent dehydrogenase (short-subunit alcohol dehydrogenase family)
MTGSLEGRIALVTGCTGGIGSEISRQLAEAGATVIGADLPAEAGGWQGDSYLSLDVTDEVSWQSAIGAVEAQHGRRTRARCQTAMRAARQRAHS